MSKHFPNPFRRAGLTFSAMLAVATVARAGVNTWTGGGPATAAGFKLLIAADPRDPYVVYAAFQPDLYKSEDGGRSWTRLAHFESIDSLLVHPAAPDTVYAGVHDDSLPDFIGVVKSSDGGLTWEQKRFHPSVVNFSSVGALVGSPTDGNTVFAGAYNSFFKTTDGGDSWTQTTDLSAPIASLVVPPREPQVVYAATEADYYFFHFGAFSRSGDQGSTWSTTDLGPVHHVSSVAADPEVASRVFIGLARNFGDFETGIRLSEDSGVTFTRSDAGLHADASVTSLVFDPTDSSVLYAGTDAGVYRSRDSGSHWWPFGQILWGHRVDSLAISSDGRRLHAGTASFDFDQDLLLASGAFDLDLVSGPVDVAASPGGGARVLRWNSDRLAVQTVDGSDNWTATPFSGTSPTWTGVAIATAPDGRARVLWQNGDRRSALQIVGSAREDSVVLIEQNARYLPTDVAVGTDGTARLLFADAAGAVHVGTLRADGTVTRGFVYGPTPGWRAIAIDVAPDGRTWVLWRSVDGRAAVSVHGSDGGIVTTVKWGATADWSVEDLGVGIDGRARVLARTVGGSMQIWTVGEDGTRSVGATHESPGLVPRRIAGGSDGLTRVLWGGENAGGEVWFLDNAGNHVAVEVPALP